jgi:hypothetical protein
MDVHAGLPLEERPHATEPLVDHLVTDRAQPT